MKFCELLTKYRERSELSKTELAKKLGITLSYIIDLEAARKKPPTFERCHAIGKILKLSDEELKLLFKLAQEGRRKPADKKFIEQIAEQIWTDAKKNNSKIPSEAIPIKDFVKVPLLGSTPAGPKAFVPDEVEEWLSLPKELAKGKRLYLLRVTGDSMDLSGIKNGSLIIVDADAEPKNKDIIVIRINDEATIKRFKKYGKMIVLTPESSNPIHKEQIYTKKDDIQLRGVVKGVWW